MTEAADDVPAPFAGTKAALRFALNLDGSIKSPLASRAMAAVPAPEYRLPSRARRGTPLAEQLAALKQAKEAAGEPRAPRKDARHDPLRGLDRVHQAGVIMQHFGRLDEVHRAVLGGVATIAYRPCSCGALCCSGRRPSVSWLSYVAWVCQHLQEDADVRGAGGRGLGTEPRLREAIVKDYMARGDLTLTRAAEIGGVSLVTAAKHRDWILAWLGRTEGDGWQELDLVFEQAGITGPPE